MNSISANLNVMIKACEKASKILIRDFGEVEKLQVSKKGPLDFVTNSDLKAEKIIIEELKKARPNYSIISEEDGSETNDDKDNIWIIDPIDGTTNFLHGIPHFAISIALKSKGEIIAGIIYDPIKNELFYAEKNNGAFFNNQRVRVSKRKNLNDCLFVTGGKEKKEIEIIKEFLPEQMSEQEVSELVSKIISEVGAQNMKDMGKVMGSLKPLIAGKADAGVVSQLVKKALS